MNVSGKFGKYGSLLIISLSVAVTISIFTYNFLNIHIRNFIYSETVKNIERETEIIASNISSSSILLKKIFIFKQINYVKDVQVNPKFKPEKGIEKNFIYPDGSTKVVFILDDQLIKQKASTIAKKLSITEFAVTSILMMFILIAVRKFYLVPLKEIDREVTKISEGKLQKLKIATEDEFGRIRESINTMIDALKEREAKAGIISQFIYLLTIGKGFNGEFIELMRKTMNITNSDGVILGIREKDSEKVLLKMITPNDKEDIVKTVNELQGIEPYILEFGKEVEFTNPAEKGILSQREINAGINYVFGLPLEIFSSVKGFIIFYRKRSEPFTQSEKDYLRSIARSISISVEVKDLIKTLEKNIESEKQLFESSIKALVRGIEIRDSYTRGHSERVAYFSMRIAEELGLSEKEVKDIYFAALLHDIGKIGIPDSILLKPSKLTDEEYEIIKMHPILSYEMLSGIDALKDSLSAIKYHHERLDGTGYPEGLKGEEIPLSARIIAVADTFDAMTSDRIYRKGYKREEALKEIVKLAGTYFDPDVVHAAVPIFKGEEPLIVKHDYLTLKEIESRRLDYFFRDHLTGAFNRNAFEYIYSQIQEKQESFAIVAVDIVKLRDINLQKGWKYGDQLLQKVVKELNNKFAPFATVRYSGDNFVIFIPSELNDEAIKEKMDKIIESIECPVNYYVFRNTEDKELIMRELTKIEQLGYQKP